MKYYLVALFDKDSYSYVETIQKDLCRKYKLYKNLPTLHLTMEIIDNADITIIEKIITDILKPYKKFKIELNGAICFDPPFKSVNLKVEDKGYIIRLIRKINDALKSHGVEVRQNIDSWDLHVSLASTNFAIREWSTKEYAAACENTKKGNTDRMLRIDRIELWKPINNKKEMVVKSFPLREY